jgi:predicted phage terminase large subunit-like protein
MKVYKNRNRFTVIVAGRRFGKTILSSVILVVSAIKQVGVYWWVSPTKDVGRPAWRLVKNFIKKVYGETVRVNETLKVIELPNGSVIEFKSADNPDSLRGEGLTGLVIDECAQIKEEAWTESLRPALSDKKGWVIFIGTPKKRNWFFHLWKRAESLENWSRFAFTTYDNPYIDKNEIDEAKKVMSEREFRQEYLAEFVSDEGFIFRKEWFANRYIPPHHEILETFISWDTAASISGTAAYSCGVVGQITKDYKLFIPEVYRERLEFPQLQYRIETLGKKYLSTLRGIIVEQKSSGISVIQSLQQTTTEEISRLIYGWNPKGSKEARGYEAAKWAEKGSIILPPYENNSWLIDYEEELLSFPDSQYVDQVDATTQLITCLSNYLERGLN